MSSEASDPKGQPSEDGDAQRLPVVRDDRTNIWDVLKTTLPVLLAGTFGVVGLVAIAWIGVPIESVKWVAVTLCFAGPFAAAYSYLFVWKLHQHRGRYHLILDPEHKKIGLKRLDPDAHRDAEVVGRPATRQSRAGAGTVTIHGDAEVEQRETVDDQGEPKTVRRRVFTSNWEGFVPRLKVLERWRAHETAVHRLVPLSKSALDVRASVDTKTLEATDKSAHALIKGAEEDAFVSSEDPWDWDVHDRTDLDDVWRTDANGSESELPDDLDDLQTEHGPEASDD